VPISSSNSYFKPMPISVGVSKFSEKLGVS
jgi:hypothetical protein